MNKKILYIFGLLFTAIISHAQSHLYFGEWKSYLPFNKSFSLSATPNKIFCSSEYSLYSIDKDDFSIEFYDKVNVLSDVEIIDHIYDHFNNQLVIVYRNGNMDVMTDGELYNITDILENTTILGKKKLNDIIIGSEDYAYLAFDYGITQFNLKTYEFGFTCFTDFPVNSLVKKGNKLFMGSDNGIYAFDFEKRNNPADFLQWEKVYAFPVQEITAFNDKLYSVYKDTLFYLDDDGTATDVYIDEEPEFYIKFITVSNDILILGIEKNNGYSSKVVFIDKEHNIQKRDACPVNLADVLIDEKGRIWYSDEYDFLKYTEGFNGECNKITIDGPPSAKCMQIKTKDDKIFIAPGGVHKINYTYTDPLDFSGFYMFSDGKWTVFNGETVPEMKEKQIFNVITVQPDKSGKTVFAGSHWAGLLELNLEDNSAKVWDETNSKLDVAQGDYERVRIADLTLDNDGDLWITDFLALKPLVVYTKDKQWFSFKLQNGINEVADLEVDQNNYKWMQIINKGILVYDNANTIEDPTDDRQIILTTANTNLPSNNVNAIKTDRDGSIWVGTDAGPLVFECGSALFEGKCKGVKKKTVLEGIPAYVLDKVNITAIEVDGANRKWIGSTSGLYVLDANGEEELMHFTVDNSPLFDDNITSLAYNGESGEMIIGTAKGVLSYKTKTLAGRIRNSYYAYAYPNPVPPDYHGYIAIKGLATDANVKIADINGRLVYETKALGGQAIWDGLDLNGKRVNSGVYLIFSTGTTNYDTPEAIALKLFFIR